MMVDRAARQIAVDKWIRKTFGKQSAEDKVERLSRLVEEVCELCQAENFPQAMIPVIADYVYKKPAGWPQQELGGVGVCILAYAMAAGYNADDMEQREFARILALPTKHFRGSRKKKADAPKGTGPAVTTEPPKEDQPLDQTSIS